MHVAEWVYDPRGKHVTPDDDEAIRLSLDEAHWPGPRQASPAATATVTPIGSRAGSTAAVTGTTSRHSDHRTDHRAESDRGVAGRAMLHPSRQPAAPVTTVAAAIDRPVSVDQADAAPQALSRDQGREQSREQGRDQGREQEPDRDQPADQDEADQGPPAGEPAARPARRASGGRSRRSSVPSWDEIMFGNSRQPD